MSRPLVVVAGVLLVVLSALLSAWGAFLVPLRVGGTLAPVSLVVALVGPVVVVRAALAAAGRVAGGAAAAVWVAVTLLLGTARSEGDVVIAQGTVGLGYLVLGCGAAAVSYASGATPRGPDSRSRAGERGTGRG